MLACPKCSKVYADESKICYFKSNGASWDELFEEAAQFASDIGPQRLISISHSADSAGVIAVWYGEDTA